MSRGGCGWKILRIADEKLSIRFSAILNDGISNLVIFKFQFKPVSSLARMLPSNLG